MVSVDSENPWNKKIQWFFTYKGILFTFYVMSIAIAFGCFQKDMRYLIKEIKIHSFVPVSAYPQENCTTLGSSGNCYNVTVVKSSSDDTFNFQTRFFIFLGVELIFVLVLWINVNYSRYYYESFYLSALVRNCKVSKDLEVELTSMKCRYLRENPRLPPARTRYVSREEYGLHKFVSEDLVFGEFRKFNEVRESLEDVMFRHHSADPFYLFIHVVEWLNDMLKAVKIMHKRNMYHLNLQPRTLYLHWLQSNSKTSCHAWSYEEDKADDFSLFLKSLCRLERSVYKAKRHLVIDDFDHAVRSENGKVHVQQVGIPRHYRPPECFNNIGMIDAAKFDAWCIGIIAYELFTGGQLVVHVSRYPPQSTCEEIINDTLNKEFISTALQERLRLFDCFLKIRFKWKTFDSYDLDQTVFATDCLTFLKGLLKSDPIQRLSVQQALKHPLMKRVRKEKGKIYYINNHL